MSDHPNVSRLLILSIQHLDPTYAGDRYVLNPFNRLVCTLDIPHKTELSPGFERILELAEVTFCPYIFFNNEEPPLKSLLSHEI